MIDAKKEKLIRQYAAGEISWHDLRERGFDDYVQVLGALGELGLRPPINANGETVRDSCDAAEHSVHRRR